MLKKKKLELDTSGSVSGGLEKYIYIYIYRHMNGSSVLIIIRIITITIIIIIIIIIISSLCFISEYEREFCSY